MKRYPGILNPQDLKPDAWIIAGERNLFQIVAIGSQSVIVRENRHLVEVTFSRWLTNFWCHCRVIEGDELAGYLRRRF